MQVQPGEDHKLPAREQHVTIVAQLALASLKKSIPVNAIKPPVLTALGSSAGFSC